MTEEIGDLQRAREARRERRRRASYRRVRWWLRAMVVSVLLVFAAYTAWVAILTPQRVADFVSRLLADSTQARVRVGAARVAFPGVLFIDDLEMRLPNMDPQLGRLLEVDQATLTFDMMALLKGSVRADKLTLAGPVVYVSELPDLQLYNYQLLPPGEQLDEDPHGLANVPEIHINGGRLQFGTIRDGAYESGEVIAVTGRMLHDMRSPGWFAFMLRQHLQGGEDGSTFSGHVNMATGAFDAELDRLSIDSPQRNLVPERFREWWDRLSPSGSFPHASVAYDPESATPWSAEITVDGVGLMLPFGEKPIDLEMASGSVRFADNAVFISGFKGQIDQVAYEIDGSYEGISADAPFHVETKLSGVWPNDPETLTAIPPHIRKHIDRFSPKGAFRGAVTASRADVDSKLNVQGRIELLNVSMLYEKFPYPMHSGTGEITFTESQILLSNMKGLGSDGALMGCEGVIENPGPAAEVRLVITGKGVPIDEALLEAMKPQVRNLTQMFFNEASHERMGKLIALDKVGGKADIVVHVVRPAGVGMRTEAVVNATPATPIQVSFEHWPYPMRIESGNLQVAPGKYVRIADLKITSPTGVVGEVNGDLLPHEKTGKLVPDIQFELDRMPVDDVLLATLPTSHAEQLRNLRIEGNVAAIGTVFHSDATGRIEFDARAHLVDGKAAPFGGGRTLERVEAEMQVRLHEFVLETARMSHAGGEYRVDGRLQWEIPPVANGATGQDNRPAQKTSQVTLHAAGSNIVVDESLLDLAPPETKHIADLRSMFQQKRLAGVTDIDVTYTGIGDDVSFDLTCVPSRLSFDQNGERIDVSSMKGKLVVAADKLRLEKVGGVFGADKTGRFDMTGEATFDEGFRLKATANVESDVKNDDALAMLPAGVVDALDRMKVAGVYKLSNMHLLHHPSAKTGDKLQIGAIVSFENIEAKIGSADVQRLDGEAQVAMRQPAATKHPLIDSMIELHRMALAGRSIRDVEFRLVSDGSDASRLLLRDLTGVVAGGELLGQGWFGVEKNSQYSVELSLADADLEQLVNRRVVQQSTKQVFDRADDHADEDAGRSQPSKKQNITGLVTGRLNVAGRFGDTDSTRGGGVINVHEAHLYELPVVLGMVQLINLALPVSSSFDEAAVVFKLKGAEALLERITFNARGVQIVGSGTVNHRTQQIDVMLTTRNPNAPDIWPISDLFNAVKDGLVKVQVSGTLREPRTRLVGLRGVKDDAQSAARAKAE